MSSNKTTLVRINKKLKQELRLRFPEVRDPDLFEMMYNTSGLKAVANGRKVFGNARKKKTK